MLLNQEAGNSCIDYALSGRIRCVEIYGKKLYDEAEKFEAPEWRKKLKEFVIAHGLDKDDGHGCHAFIHDLFAEPKPL